MSFWQEEAHAHAHTKIKSQFQLLTEAKEGLGIVTRAAAEQKDLKVSLHLCPALGFWELFEITSSSIHLAAAADLLMTCVAAPLIFFLLRSTQDTTTSNQPISNEDNEKDRLNEVFCDLRLAQRRYILASQLPHVDFRGQEQRDEMPYSYPGRLHFPISDL